MKYLLNTFLYIIITTTLFAQQKTNKGKDFWMSFMEYPAITADHVILLTSQFNSNVSIRIPNQNFNTTVFVPAGGITQVPVTDFAGVYPIGEGLHNKGIHITSDNDITVYAHQYDTMLSEASIVLPSTSLGTEYYVLAYDANYQTGKWYHSEFVIVATEDQTIIDIIPSSITKSLKPAGIPFQISLDSGEVYQVQSKIDLTGSNIKSSKKIAVFGGSPLTGVPAGAWTRDNLYEQMYPVSSFGTKYMLNNFDNTVRTPGLPFGPYFDVIRIVASEDNTDIYVNNTYSTTINKGQFIQDSIFGPSIIETSKPTLVAQYMISNYGGNTDKGDPAMVVLNDADLVLDTAIFYASPLQSISNNYVNIYCHTKDTNLITVDGTGYASSFNTFSTDTNLSYATISISSGYHTIVSNGCGGFQAIAYGLGGAESYAYAAGVNLAKSLDMAITNFNTAALPYTGCVLDTFEYQATASDSIISLIWNFGDMASGTNDTSTSLVPQHIYSDTGEYVVTVFAFIWKNCSVDTLVDTQSLSIGRIGASNYIIPDTTCTDAIIQFLNGNISMNDSIINYDWTFGDGFTDSIKNPTHTYTNTGDYWVTIQINSEHGCKDNDSIPINVTSPPLFNALGDTSVCNQLNSTIGNIPKTGQSYSWQPSTGLDNPNISNPTVDLFSAIPNKMDYILNITDNASSCIISDTIIIDFKGTLTLNNGIDSISVSINECTNVIITDNGVPPYFWSPTAFTNLTTTNTIEICPEETNIYTVTDSNNCKNNIKIKVIELYQIDIPLAFTPNQDNLNDLLSLFYIGIDYLNYFRIYNRWGQQVFFTKDTNFGWDGKFKGKEQPTGEYIYELEARSLTGETINRKGQFALIR